MSLRVPSFLNIPINSVSRQGLIGRIIVDILFAAVAAPWAIILTISRYPSSTAHIADVVIVVLAVLMMLQWGRDAYRTWMRYRELFGTKAHTRSGASG